MNKKLFQYILLPVLLWLPFIFNTSYAEVPSNIHLIRPDKLQFKPIHFVPPQAQRVVLDNGIILFIFEDQELPLVNVSAVIRTGANYDPDGKEGLSEVTGLVMRSGGTHIMTGNEIDDALDYFAGSLVVSMNSDSGSINLSIQKKNLDEGLNIFSQIIMHPSFEESKLKLAKDLKVEELRRIGDDPQKLAFREFKRILYHNNPEGKLSSVTTINNIQRDDLIQFYKKFFSPKNLMIAISGDISKDQAINKIKQYFGSWNESKKDYIVPQIPAKQKGHVYFLSKDIPQSIIILAQLAPGKNNQDAYPFTVLDFILGSGGFKSRIFQQIRNNRGLAYSTGSFYSKKGAYGVFGAYAITKADTTAEVISHIQSIIRDAMTKSVDNNELTGAIKSINNNFIFSFNSAEQIAHLQLMMEYDNMPEGYIVTYRDKIAKVQAEDLKRVSNIYLASDDAVILVVGNESAYKQLMSSFKNVFRIEGQI